MKYIIQFLLTAGVIYTISQYHLVEGIILERGYISALIFAVILALVNIILGTFLRIITFPIRLITLGVFTFAIFLIVVYVTDYLVPGVTLQSVFPAVTIAIAASVTSFVIKLLS